MHKNIIILFLFLISKKSFCFIILGTHGTIPVDVGVQCPHIQYVDVVWKTDIEFNNDWFQVLRSTDPSGNSAIEIGARVNGCGTCSGHTYHVIDYGPFTPGTTYYYSIQAVSNSANYTYHDIGSVFFPIPTVIDWKSQVTAQVIVGSTPNDMNQYVWSEELNTKQGVSINLIPTEISPIYLEQNNSKINFTLKPSLASLIVNIDVSIDNQGYTNIYNGSSITNFIWHSISSLTSSVGQHSLSVNWLDPISQTNFHREYDVYVVPQSSKLYIDNHCNTMRLWEGNDPGNEIPVLICEGFDSYNTAPEQYYRSAGDAMFSCLLQKGFKVYILDLKFNSQDMRINAAVYSSAVKYISDINNNIKIVAGGISMGGVIARYALAKAENDANPLPVTKFVSIDSPQQGAVVSDTLQKFKKAKQQNDAFAIHGIDNDAAKELLNYNALDPSGSMHNTFYNELNNLNGDGYPHLTTNIGVSFSNDNPNTNNGTWLKVFLDQTFWGITVANFDLTPDEKVAGSYLPSISTAIDPVQRYIHWALNLLVITQPFNNPEVTFARYLNPTFIPHESSLDIVNGQSKFDLTIVPDVTSYHDVVPDDIIDTLLNAMLTDNVYLQNKDIFNIRTYIAGKTITAGNNVNPNPNIPAGNFIVENGANVTFKTGQEIRLKPGFHAKAGSNFHAFITSPVTTCDGVNENQMKINNNQPRTQIPSLENINIKMIQANTFFQQHNITITPNPTSGSFTISLKENTQGEVFIYNSLGQVVFQSTINNPQFAINISSRPRGIYFLKVINREKIYTQKIILSAE